MIPLRDVIPSRTVPYLTVTIIILNALAWFYELSLPREELPVFLQQFGVVPAYFSPPTLISSMFLHGSWSHVLGNMWFLWIFGDNIEDILGHGKYLVFYLLCGMAAGLTHVFLNGNSRVPTVGASGAIAGIMGAYMVKFPRSRIVTLVFVFIFVTTFEVPALVMLLYWFVIQLFSGVGSVGYSHVSEGGTAWFAHVGGFVAGILLINLMGARQPWSRRRDLSW